MVWSKVHGNQWQSFCLVQQSLPPVGWFLLKFQRKKTPHKPVGVFFFQFPFTHISGKTDVLSNDLFSAKYIPLTTNKKTGFKNSALFGICTEHSTWSHKMYGLHQDCSHSFLVKAVNHLSNYLYNAIQTLVMKTGIFTWSQIWRSFASAFLHAFARYRSYWNRVVAWKQGREEADPSY